MPLSKIVANSITDDTITTDQIADNSVHGRRNMVINGAMQIAQRGTTSTGFVASSAYLTVDRFKCENGSSGTFTVSQATDAPAGFANSLKFDCTTADSSPDYFLIVHRFEGQNLQHLEKGTSASKKTTLSFHVKSNKTGTYQVNFRDVDNSRLIGKTYTISAANTWEKKTVTFDGDTSGVLGNDNGNSMQLEWWLASGSTYNSGSVPTVWGAIANGDRAAGLNVHIGASTDDEFYITGIQFEVGDKATPFEHRSYGEELALCQRYFFREGNVGEALHYVTLGPTGGQRWYFQALPVQMRADPTDTIYADNSQANSGKCRRDDNTLIDITGSYTSQDTIGFLITNGTANNLYFHDFDVDAEL